MSKDTFLAASQHHDNATRTLIAAVQYAFPIGATVAVTVRNGVRIRAVIESHWASLKWPCEITVRNTKTGKTRNASVHPNSFHRVEVIHSENGGGEVGPPEAGPLSTTLLPGRDRTR